VRKLKVLFYCCVLLFCAFNLYRGYAQAVSQINDHTTIPLHSLGYPFMGLENMFKGVRTVGYYTDKNLDNPLAVAQFEQAQYMLAPTVLDLNHTQWRWVIFDCTSPGTAINLIKLFGFVPLKINHGIILALNPNGE
jgi:hypothetical protein